MDLEPSNSHLTNSEEVLHHVVAIQQLPRDSAQVLSSSPRSSQPNRNSLSKVLDGVPSGSASAIQCDEELESALESCKVLPETPGFHLVSRSLVDT